MALETSAERQQTIDDAKAATLNFLKRSRSMSAEAAGYVSALQTAKTDLQSAKAASDAAVANDNANAVLASENAILAAKITEIDAVITQANSIKTAIEALV